MTITKIAMNDWLTKTKSHVFDDFLPRIKEERIHITAGYLAYVSLMSLVPLLVVMFSVLTAFPLFAEIRDGIENFVYQNFIPASSEVIREHISGFVAKASQMSVIALSFLFIFALLMVSAVDKSLNHIFAVKESRRWTVSFAMYWMVLTLGPIMVSVSIALSSYILALMPDSGAFFSKFMLVLLPYIVSFVAFTLLYVTVPNKFVPLKHAMIGAGVCAVMFEVAKKGFAFYVLQLPSYQAIYGALATIPILFLWVYLSWLIVLTGAVVTVSLSNWGGKNSESD